MSSQNRHRCPVHSAEKRGSPVVKIPLYTPSYSKIAGRAGRAHGGFIDTKDVIPAASEAPKLFSEEKPEKSVVFIGAMKDSCIFGSGESICFQIGFSVGRETRKILSNEAGSSFKIQEEGTYRISFEGAIITEKGEATIHFKSDHLEEVYSPLTHFDIPKPHSMEHFNPVNVSTILPLKADSTICVNFSAENDILIQGGSRIQIYRFP